METYLLMEQRAAAAALRDAMRSGGAVSPATAKPLTALPPLSEAQFQWALERGVVREGAPGTFYLFESTSSGRSKGAWIRTILFWLLIALIPVLLIQFSGSR
jgi:hypothetical protein